MMKSWILCAAAIVLVVFRVAADDSIYWAVSGNSLHLSDVPNDKLSTASNQFLAPLRSSKVPSREKAIQSVLYFFKDQPPFYMVDARGNLVVVGLYRIARDIPDFASQSDFIWVVNANWVGHLMQVFYISASTGKVLTIFPEATKRIAPPTS